MNQRLVQYSPEMEISEDIHGGPLDAVARRSGSAVGVFTEGDLLQIAAEVLEGRDATALDHALAGLVDRAARALATRLDPHRSRALRGVLQSLAQRVLPFAGRTLGGDPGRAVGNTLTSRAMHLFGLELEGLSNEDKEFELAKAFARLAGDAVRQLAAAPPKAGPPQDLAARAVALAARNRAPGLFADSPGERTRVRKSATHATHALQEPTMHDIDRTQREFANEFNEFEGEQFEFGENEWSQESSGAFSEAEELELATELLSVSSEGELDRFLGDLVGRATKAFGSFVRSPAGQAVGGILKGVAKKALPLAGGAIGGYFGGPLGAKIGSGLANAAGSALGLEGEMANEDREFEGAKQFVRLAAQTATTAANAPAGADPRMTAQRAAMAAASQLAPGLLNAANAANRAAGAGPAQGPAHAQAQAGAAAMVRSGRWMRRGNKIVLYGA